MGRLTADDFQAWPPQGLQARCGRGRRTPPPSNSAQSQSLQPPKPAKAAPTELIYSFRTSGIFCAVSSFGTTKGTLGTALCLTATRVFTAVLQKDFLWGFPQLVRVGQPLSKRVAFFKKPSSATRYRKGRLDIPRIWLVDHTKSLFTSGGRPRVCTYTQGHVRNGNRQFWLFMQTHTARALRLLTKTPALPPSCRVGPKIARAAPDLRSRLDTAVLLIPGCPGMRAC